MRTSLRKLPMSGMIAVPAILSVIVIVASFVESSPLLAQSPILSLPTDRTVSERLALADQALQRDDIDRALELWQDILDGGAGVVASYRVPRGKTDERAALVGDRFVGVRADVMHRIRAGGASRVARYRKVMEPRARHLLSAAKGDEFVYRECVRRYGMTPSGRDAAFLLADLWLEAGRFEEARIAARRIRAESFGADKSNDDRSDLERRAWSRAVVVEAMVLYVSGRTGDIERLRSEANQTWPAAMNHRLRFAGRATTANDHLTAMMRGKHGAPRRSSGSMHSTSSMQSKTNPLSSTAAPPKLTELAHRTPIVRHVGRRRRWRSRSYDNDDVETHYAVVPSVCDGVLFIHDGLSMSARRLRSGEVLWDAYAAVDEFVGQAHHDLVYEVTIDDDLVFASLHGKAVLDRSWGRTDRSIPSHDLVAVDRRTGKVRWSHHDFVGRTDQETAFVRELSICQPPLVVGETIFVTATLFKGAFHHWLCAFERATGRLRWKSFLGSGQTQIGRGGTPRKSAIPSPVTEHDGILYACTNMGVVSAVDAVTGSIQWQGVYESARKEEQDEWGRHRRYYSPERSPRWMPSRPVVHGEHVFFAPSDATHLHAARRRNGELVPIRDAFPDKDERRRALIGLHEGRLVVAGTTVAGIDPTSFEIVWRAEPSDEELPWTVEGRPFVANGSVVFTTRTTGGICAMHRVDIASGQTLSTTRFALSQPGNVVVEGPTTIIATRDTVEVFKD